MTESLLSKPQLATGVRLRWDGVRERHVLLYPEGALVLNGTAADVLELCDGRRTIDEIAQELSPRYQGADVRDDVERLVTTIAERGLVVDADA
jgi:pyrroloquinoline quinone biosynthesis protein D